LAKTLNETEGVDFPRDKAVQKVCFSLRRSRFIAEVIHIPSLNQLQYDGSTNAHQSLVQRSLENRRVIKHVLQAWKGDNVSRFNGLNKGFPGEVGQPF